MIPPAADAPALPESCDSDTACVFAKALLARNAICSQSSRRSVAERTLLDCRWPVAHTNCSTLAALLHERSRFALRLPAPERPLTHMQALRLQCGGLAALQQVLAAEPGLDVHGLIGLAHARHGSLTELPWDALVAALAAWQPRRRAGTHPRP